MDNKKYGTRASEIGKKTIEFGTITSVVSVSDLNGKSVDSKDKIISRFQNSKQGMLKQIRTNSSNTLKEIGRKLEIKE